jgi:hypothetical protein
MILEQRRQITDCTEMGQGEGKARTLLFALVAISARVERLS